VVTRRISKLCYKNGKDILPPELLEQLQKYVQGELIYIPREKCKRKAWGETNGTRITIRKRNHDIYSLYKNGTSIDDLIETYNLSEDSIRKIILKVNSEVSDRTLSNINN
jgi:Mor family transcriptional regulator